MAASKSPPGSAKARATASAKDAFVDVLDKTVAHAKSLGAVRTSGGPLFPGGINDIEVELTVEGVGGFRVALKGPEEGAPEKAPGGESGVVNAAQLRGGVWILRDGDTDIGFMLSSKYDRDGKEQTGYRFEHWIFLGSEIDKTLTLKPRDPTETDPDPDKTMNFIEDCANDKTKTYNYIQARCSKFERLRPKP